MSALYLIISALEALEVGDQRLATEILLGAIEDGPAERPHVCECGFAAEWPGLLEAHRLSAGHEFARDREAAAA